MKVAGLAGDTGERLLAVIERSSADVEFALVGATDPDAPVVEGAHRRGIETFVIGEGSDPTVAAVRDRLADRGVDLVCLDGYDVAAGDLPGTVLAVSPSLWPGRDDDPVGQALSEGVEVSGATVEVLGPEGGILTQQPVPVRRDDDRERLRARLDEAGVEALVRALERFAAGRVTVDDGVQVEGDDGDPFPARWVGTADRRRSLRYGENPHQDAALYSERSRAASVVDADQLNEGARALSYNNYNDADAALELVREFERPAAAVIKHTNPAGCATAADVSTAYDRALSTDPQSAFGGIVALNRTCDSETAAAITESFKEVVVAPDYTSDALDVLRAEDSLRVLAVGDLAAPSDRPPSVVETQLTGGRLLQDRDDQHLSPSDLETVTEREPTEEQVESMLFAWQVVKHVKSNAILFASGTETVGIGAGQMSRVDAVRIAGMKADEHAEGKSADGAVMASDAFFPFPDGVEHAAEAGVEAVIQPGGSVNDEDVIAAADDLGLAMVFTGQRAFRHD